MTLGEIRIVNLRDSVWDKEASKPDKGEYVFQSKRYVPYDISKCGSEPMPEHFITWERYENRSSYREISQAKASGFSYVVVGDPYWPEGVAPDAEGKYVYGDVVLMKCPIVAELQRRIDRDTRNRNGVQQSADSFNAAARAAGVTPYQELLGKI